MPLASPVKPRPKESLDTSNETNGEIRPPDGVTLPRGEIAVTVRSRQPEPTPAADALAPTRDWLLALAAEAEHAAPNLPRDLAEHHDH